MPKVNLNIKERTTHLWSLLKDYPDLFERRLIFTVTKFLTHSTQPIRRRINKVIFEFDFAYDPAIRDMFRGKYERHEIKILKEILRPVDTFIDAGANIGYFSAVAAGLVGQTGAIHSFEPVPEYFQKLQRMATLNPDYQIITNQCALGETEGDTRMDITARSNIGWNTLVNGLMRPEERKQTIMVPVRRLDNYIKEHNLSTITLIKIDVEGFEFPVLRGLSRFLETTTNRPVILCEITPAAYSLLGYQVKDLFDYMRKFGYSAFDMTNKRIDWPDIKELSNILFKPE